MLGLGAGGCSASFSATGAQTIAGSVTVDGRPMKTGTIVFFPYDDGKTLRTVSASEMIRNGRFTVPRSKGLAPARYRIAVFGGKDESAQPDTNDADDVDSTQVKDKLPARFNLASELEVEITRRAIKELKIDIESK
jgi:hypothetical protein